jgi:hypothetical protein
MVLIVLIVWHPEKFKILWKRKVEIIS